LIVGTREEGKQNEKVKKPWYGYISVVVDAGQHNAILHTGNHTAP